MIYYKKSYDIWQRLDDKLFLLLTCRHITSLAQELNISAENAVCESIENIKILGILSHDQKSYDKRRDEEYLS